jgi:radical SAM-linked protein
MQRLRIRFKRGPELKFISHLDIMRLWIRALRRAQIPLTYSEGFNPRPRISIAAPLSVGVTGENEFMDILVDRPVSPHWLMNTVNRQLPPGIEILEVYPIAIPVPSLQSQVKSALYSVEVVIKVVGCREGICTLEMNLRSDEIGSGRPEQVVYALGFNEHPRSIHRVKLTLSNQR